MTSPAACFPRPRSLSSQDIGVLLPWSSSGDARSEHAATIAAPCPGKPAPRRLRGACRLRRHGRTSGLAARSCSSSPRLPRSRSSAPPARSSCSATTARQPIPSPRRCAKPAARSRRSRRSPAASTSAIPRRGRRSGTRSRRRAARTIGQWVIWGAVRRGGTARVGGAQPRARRDRHLPRPRRAPGRGRPPARVLPRRARRRCWSRRWRSSRTGSRSRPGTSTRANRPGQGILAECTRFDEGAFESFRDAYQFLGPERFQPADLVPGT